MWWPRLNLMLQLPELSVIIEYYYGGRDCIPCHGCLRWWPPIHYMSRLPKVNVKIKYQQLRLPEVMGTRTPRLPGFHAHARFASQRPGDQNSQTAYLSCFSRAATRFGSSDSSRDTNTKSNSIFLIRLIAHAVKVSAHVRGDQGSNLI